MNLIHSSAISTVLVAFLCVSCKEDPALIEKKNSQAAEITRLKGEIELLEEKIKNLPPDVSDELETKRAEVTRQEARIKQLEVDVRGQEDVKNSIQREFDAYRAKYKIN